MFAYELHKITAAELIRAADHHRLVREARRAQRQTRQARGAAKDGGEGRVRQPCDRFVRAA